MTKGYSVENIFTDEVKPFRSLKKAVEYAIGQRDSANLVTCGNVNLDCYVCGDTVETLYNRCKSLIEKFS